MPVFEVGHGTSSKNAITYLIPGMNFTYPATIVGFIVAGTSLNQEPHSKIQIWRRKSSQSCVYYRVESEIVVNIDIVCVSLFEVVDNVFSCILNDTYRVSVQSGDFLGLELPQTSDDRKIYFTSGGPTNYIFQGELNSTIELINDSGYTTMKAKKDTLKTVQSQSQIALNLTLGMYI